jgi:hypothetical protein
MDKLKRAYRDPMKIRRVATTVAVLGYEPDYTDRGVPDNGPIRDEILILANDPDEHYVLVRHAKTSRLYIVPWVYVDYTKEFAKRYKRWRKQWRKQVPIPTIKSWMKLKRHVEVGAYLMDRTGLRYYEMLDLCREDKITTADGRVITHLWEVLPEAEVMKFPILAAVSSK